MMAPIICQLQFLTLIPPRPLTLLSPNKSASLRWRCNLCNIDWYLGTTNANAEAVHNTANNEHRDTVGSADEDRTDTPDNSANLDCSLSSQDVGEIPRNQSTKPRTTGHGRSNPSCNPLSDIGSLERIQRGRSSLPWTSACGPLQGSLPWLK